MPWDYLLIDIVILVCYAAVASRMCGLLTQVGLYMYIYVPYASESNPRRDGWTCISIRLRLLDFQKLGGFRR